MKLQNLALVFARILLASTFIYAGIIHLADITSFALAIAAYEILPSWSVRPFAFFLPVIEILSGSAIASGLFFRAGSLVAAVMLSVFTIALSISLYRGLEIPCGCFSTSPAATAISWIDLVRDLALLVCTTFLLLYSTLTEHYTWKTIPGRFIVPVLSAASVAGIILFQAITVNPCEGLTAETINKHKRFDSAVILSKRPVTGLCEVLLQTKGGKVALYGGKSFIIEGEMFSKETNLTKEGLKLLTSSTFLAMRQDIDYAVSLTYSPEGEIKQTLYMFSSPECPHCHAALESMLPILNETQTELKILLIAVGKDWSKATCAICLDLDLKDYLFDDWPSRPDCKKPSCPQGEATLKKSLEIAQKLDINSVPVFFTQEGLRFAGSNIEAMERHLREYSGGIID